MSSIEIVLGTFRDVAAHPRAQLDRYLADGKQVVGCTEMYAPAELVEAAGAVPFGLWGAQTEVAAAKEYFPPFICSIMQTTLDLGLRGTYHGLSGVVVPHLCDSMKCFGQNWAVGVPDVPFLPIVHPQNRTSEAALPYLVGQLRHVRDRLAEIVGHPVDDAAVGAAIARANAHRAALRQFVVLAGEHPDLVSPAARAAVLKARWFQASADHLAALEELNGLLAAAPAAHWDGLRVVTSGIIADSPGLLAVLEENGVAVVGDDVAHESRQFRTDIPVVDDPIESLARGFLALRGCSVLHDVAKPRGPELVALARTAGAQGVLLLMTKFCDPEEFDLPILTHELTAAGLPNVTVEVDQQMVSYEQARTAVQTFADMLRVGAGLPA